MPHVEQELLILPEFLNCSQFLVGFALFDLWFSVECFATHFLTFCSFLLTISLPVPSLCGSRIPILIEFYRSQLNYPRQVNFDLHVTHSILIRWNRYYLLLNTAIMISIVNSNYMAILWIQMNY